MLTASIYTNELYKECSNGGISSRCKEVTIVNASGPVSAPTDDAPAVILVARPGLGRGGQTIGTFYPAVFHNGEWVKDNSKWWMMGGSYIACSDSRFGQLCEDLGCSIYGAVPFHDRYEG